MLLRISQRRERIGGFTGLRNEDGEIAFAERCFTIAKLRRNIDFDGKPGQAFQPIFADVAGIVSGSARDDRDPLDLAKIEREIHWKRYTLGRHVNIAGQRVSDHLRLFVDFLGHEVAIVRLIDQRGRSAMLDDLAVNDGVAVVVDGRAVVRQNSPVTVFEIADRIGERPERNRVRSQIHFAVAISDRQRRPVARTDQNVIVGCEDKTESECAAKLRQRGFDRLYRIDAGGKIAIDQM